MVSVTCHLLGLQKIWSQQVCFLDLLTLEIIYYQLFNLHLLTRKISCTVSILISFSIFLSLRVEGLSGRDSVNCIYARVWGRMDFYSCC